MEELENINEMEAEKRPSFLTVLCVLTFISAGLGVLSSLVTPLFADTFINFLKSNPSYDEATMSDTIKMIQAGWGYYLFTALLAGGSLTGAILMWNLKKIGFHVYALSNLALLFVPTLVLGIAISSFGIFLTVVFIGLYALNFKWLK
jgi:hypothetical protein